MSGGPRPEPIGPIGRSLFGSPTPPATPPDWSGGPSKALAAAQMAAQQRTPEVAKRIADLQQRTGYTSAFIADNLETLESLASAPTFDPATFARTSPIVANWLAADPNRVALLAPDLTRMSKVEALVRDVGQRFRQGMEQVELSRIGSAVLQGTVTPAQRERQRQIENARRLTQDYGNDGFLGGAIPTAAEQVPIYAQSIKAAGVGAVAGAAVGAAVALPSAVAGPEAVAPAVIAGAKFGADIGAGAMLYVANAEMEASLAVLDYERLTDANGRTLDPETAHGAALLYGVIAGGLESVGEVSVAKLVPVARGLVGDLLKNPATRDIVLRAARHVAQSVATEGATEGLQSLVQSAGGRFATAAQDGTMSLGTVRDFLTDPEVWGQAVAEGTAGAQAALVIGGGGGGFSTAMDVTRARRNARVSSAIQTLASGVRQADAATRTAQDLGDVAEQVQAAATVKEAAPEVESLLTELHQSGLDAVTYTVKDWQAFWSGVTLADGTHPDPRQVVAEVGADVTAYDHAVETGGEFRIPLAQWAARLAVTPEVRSWAVDNARVGDGAMSRAEAVQFRAALHEAMTTAAKAAEDVVDPPVRALSDQIAAAVTESLTAAGRSAREAEAGGVLWASTFRSFASKSARSPEEVAQLFARVVIAGPNAPQTMERLELSRAVAEDVAAEEAVADAETVAVEDEAALERRMEQEGKAMEEGREDIRTASGRLVANLGSVSTRAIVAELSRLYDANSAENTASRPLENSSGNVGVYATPASMKASGRVAARGKTIAKLETELASRGIDASQAVLDYIDNRNDDPTSFNFGANVDVLWQSAFHGSPHIFDKFTTAKIGTGEGAQAYGWGLYFAENEGVAEGYSKTLGAGVFRYDGTPVTGESPRRSAVELLWSWQGDVQGALDEAQSYDNASAIRREIKRLDYGKIERGGALYRVDIPDAVVARMLDWDKPLSEQAPEVQDALETLSSQMADSGDERRILFMAQKGETGAEIYRSLVAAVQDSRVLEYVQKRADQYASELLAHYGIPGIKYLDAGSRLAAGVSRIEANIAKTEARLAEIEDGTLPDSVKQAQRETLTDELARLKAALAEALATPQTRNLVIFDENDVTITHRNGEPVTAAERAQVLEQGPAPDVLRGEDGRPLTVYHGSPLRDIVAFNDNPRGLFFSDREQVAQQYTAQRGPWMGPRNGRVYAAQISMANPLVIDARGKAHDNIPVPWQEWKPKVFGALPKNAVSVDKALEYAVANGYDGVIIKNVVDRASEAEERVASTVYGVPRASQATLVQDSIALTLEQSAFHGSPHIFDKFTTAKMGTGEGAQAYGWGLYFAENEGVAAGYRDRLAKTVGKHNTLDGKRISAGMVKKLTNPSATDAALRAVFSDLGKFRPDGASDLRDFLVRRRAVIAENVDRWERRAQEASAANIVAATYSQADFLDRATAARKMVAYYDEVIPRIGFEGEKLVSALYRVDIPDAVVARMLDWDKPFEKQAKEVKQALKDSGIYRRYKDNLSNYASPQETRGSVPSGARIVAFLEWELGSQEAASKALLAAGIRGTKFFDAGSRDAGRGTRNLVIFDENDVTITHRNGEPVTAAERAQVLEQAQGGSEPRGRIVMGEGLASVRLELLAGADESTFLHESAHFFLGVWKQLAAESPDLAIDLSAVYQWLGAESGATLTVEQEEQFARGFERYLRDATSAPSLELRGAFRLFRAWLSRLYRKLTALRVDLTPEVTRLFDRMVASDAEIAAAEDALGGTPLFMEDQAIARARENATLRAREELDRETLAVVFREEEAWYADKVRETTAIVLTELNDDPAYRARAILLSGKRPDGTPIEGGNPLPKKLDRASIVALVGEERAKAFATFYRKQDGMPVEAAAGMLGFDTGSALLDALASTVPVNEHAAAVAQARVREQYGDPLTDGTVADKAMQAVHNEDRTALLRRQMDILLRDYPSQTKRALVKFGSRVPSTPALREHARQMLRARTIRSLRNGIEYQLAEYKAARDAITAATNGDWESAAEAKVREMTAHALYVETRAALDRLDADKARYAKAFRPDEKIAATRDLNYVNVARAVLATVGYGRADREPLAYLDAVSQYDPQTADELKAVLATVPIRRDDFRDLTLAEAEAVRAVYEVLWTRARTDRETMIGDRQATQEEAARLVMDALAKQPDGKMANSHVEAVWEGWKYLYSTAASLARMESVVDVLDDGDMDGPMRAVLLTPVYKAVQDYREWAAQRYAHYLKIVKGLGARLTYAPIPAPRLGTLTADGVTKVAFQFRDKHHLLGMLLHTGNLSNLDKLTRGYGWDPSEVRETIREYVRTGVLTKAEFEAVQAVWDMFEAAKPDLQRVHYRLFGYYFAEVTAEPFTVTFPDGTTERYRGGYAPATPDPEFSQVAAARKQAEEMDTGLSPDHFPTTGKGFTITRTQAAPKLLLDFGLIGRHLDATGRFLHIEPVVRPLARLFRRRDVMDAVERVAHKGVTQLVNPWLSRVALQRTLTVSDKPGLDWLARRLRRAAVGSTLFMNAANALQNVVGIGPLIAKLKADGHSPKHVARAVQRYMTSRKQMVRDVSAASRFMDQHTHQQVLDAMREISDRLEQPTAIRSFERFASDHGYIFSQLTQAAMDVIAWQAGYEAATEEGRTHEQAVAYADSVVRQSQSSANPEDVAQYQVGSPAWQFLIMMSSYFNAQLNLLGGNAARVLQSVGIPATTRGARLFYLYLFGFALPAILGDAVVKAMNAEPVDEDDDDPWLLDLIQWMGYSQVRYAAAMVPVVGQVGTATINAFNDKPYDDRITVSPGIGTAEGAVRGTTELLKQVFTDETLSKRDIRDVLTALSVATDIPVGWTYRPATAVWSWANSKEPSGPVDAVRGFVTGRP